MHLHDKFCVNAYIEWLDDIMPIEQPDVVVITGDIFESNYDTNPYEILNKIFQGRKVIFTLGNHEFFDRTVKNTLKKYEKQYNPDKYDVHCLDIIHEIDVDECHFFGNVLWYDGSMSTIYEQNLESFADGRWADRLVKNLDFIKENKRCVELIKAHQGEDWMTKILCTHTCPHNDLNLHRTKTSSPFNAYSGMANLLKDIDADYAICGHTHWRTIGKRLSGTQCINVGNEYYPPYAYYLLDTGTAVESDINLL